MPTCGHCHAKRQSITHIKQCSSRVVKVDAKPSGADFLGLDGAVAPRLPTERMLNYAHGLLRQRVPYGLVLDAEMTSGSGHEYVSGMDWAACSEFINTMKSQPLRPVQERTAKPTVGEGMYRKDDVIYKVQVAYHGSGHLYAKRLEIIEVEKEDRDTNLSAVYQGKFVRAPGALSALTEDDKMSLSEAKEFGALYGFCVRCGAILTDDDSIAAGIGPICAGKME